MLGREGEEGEEASSHPELEKQDPLGIRPPPQCLQRGHFLPDPFPHPCVAPRALRVKPSLHSPASSSAISSQRSPVLPFPTFQPLIPRSHLSPSHGHCLPLPRLPALPLCQIFAGAKLLLPLITFSPPIYPAPTGSPLLLQVSAWAPPPPRGPP